jgi:outer membrane immunogenic protein
MRQSTFALLCSTALLATGAANAADMPVRSAPAPVPYVQPFYNWNGFYMGGHLGWARSESTWNSNVFSSDPDFLFGSLGGTSTNGFVGGGQMGYNWAFNNILLGIEGQISATDLGRSRTFGPNVFGDTLTLSADVNWIGSLTGKLGFTANNWLFYMKGGGAWADADAALTAAIAGVGVFTASRSNTRSGWTIGAGVEWGFAPNWSALVEYQYYDFGGRTFTTPAIFGVGVPVNVETDIQTLKFGVNYRFATWR